MERNYVRRCGVIAELMQRCPRRGWGEIQCLVYLLQELYGADLNYRFSLYVDGPVSSDLRFDIACMENFDLDIPKAFSKKLDKHHIKLIEKLIGDFGEYSTRDLGLYATIIYVAKEVTTEKIFQTVKAIKMLFTDTEILNAIDKMSIFFDKGETHEVR